jgi:hypothetical protein
VRRQRRPAEEEKKESKFGLRRRWRQKAARQQQWTALAWADGQFRFSRQETSLDWPFH